MTLYRNFRKERYRQMHLKNNQQFIVYLLSGPGKKYVKYDDGKPYLKFNNSLSLRFFILRYHIWRMIDKFKAKRAIKGLTKNKTGIDGLKVKKTKDGNIEITFGPGYPELDKFIGHNNLTEDDMYMLLQLSGNSEQMVLDAIAYVDSKIGRCENYIGYLRHYITNLGK